jgi:hypothetical protein
VVAAGRCVETGAALPLRPLTGAMTRLVRGRPVPRQPLVEPYLRVLARLAPDLLPPGEVDCGPADLDPVHLGRDCCVCCGCSGADREALLVVEDLHGADRTTLAVVEHLADAVTDGGQPVSLLFTLRATLGPGLDLVEALAARRPAVPRPGPVRPQRDGRVGPVLPAPDSTPALSGCSRPVPPRVRRRLRDRGA